MFSFLLSSWKSFSGIIVGLGVLLYSFLINRDAKLKCENNNLKNEIGEIMDETDKIIAIQKSQAEIASVPAPARDVIYEQLRGISNRNKAKS